MRRALPYVAVALFAFALGATLPTVSSQGVANENQRLVRAQEQQANSLKSIAGSLKKMEKCR